MPRCSIVIPVYNRAGLTRKCLDGLLASPETRDQELIVVDDCSRDETPQLLAGYGDAIRVIRHETNQGYGQGVNDGTALASSEYVVHLNNDTIPVSGWLDALCRYADSHPKAAAIASKLLNVDGSVQHAGIVFCSQRRPWHLYRWFPADHPAVHVSRQFQAVTGTSLLVRKSAFVQAGGFDSSYRNSYNDVDFCLRLGTLGHESHFCHESVLYHLEGASKIANQGEDENCRRFLQRWGDHVREDEWDYYVRDGLLQLQRHNDHLELVVSPLLARVNDRGRLGELDQLLLRQSRQIAVLLREYVSLRLNNTPPAGERDRDQSLPSAEWEPAERPAEEFPRGTLRAVAEVVGHPSLRWPHDHLVYVAEKVLVHASILESLERFERTLTGRLLAGLRRVLKRKAA